MNGVLKYATHAVESLHWVRGFRYKYIRIYKIQNRNIFRYIYTHIVDFV